MLSRVDCNSCGLFPSTTFYKTSKKLRLWFVCLSSMQHVISPLLPLQLKPPKSAKKKPATAEAIAGKRVELEGFAITSSNLVFSFLKCWTISSSQTSREPGANLVLHVKRHKSSSLCTFFFLRSLAQGCPIDNLGFPEFTRLLTVCCHTVGPNLEPSSSQDADIPSTCLVTC